MTLRLLPAIPAALLAAVLLSAPFSPVLANADVARVAEAPAPRQRLAQDDPARQLHNGRSSDKARQDAAQQRQKQIEQAKQKAIEQKKQTDKARQDALQQRQQQFEQAKQKAIEQKKQTDKARQDAIQQRQQQFEQAKQKAIEQKKQTDKARRDTEEKKIREVERFKKDDRSKEVEPQRFDRTKADREFERARDEARRPREPSARDDRRTGERERWREESVKRFEEVRRGRKEQEQGARRVIVEPDKRVIVRQKGRSFIRHDESSRLERVGREVRRERRKDGTLMIVTMGLAGALIYSLQDDDGRLLRRSRKGRDGREVVLIENRHGERDRRGSRFGPDRDYDAYVDLPPPVVRIPRDAYIVDYDRASPDDLYDALSAPPIERMDRAYSLDEVRHSYRVLERMRRVDLDTVTFAFGAWDVDESQYPKLERIATALRRILDRSPDEVFLIEGHTDAVGSDIDNLSLSDRRAETVAIILTDEFGVPPENLTTQGYGEQHLKVPTEEPSRINRRVSVRRITPLLSRGEWDDR